MNIVLQERKQRLTPSMVLVCQDLSSVVSSISEQNSVIKNIICAYLHNKSSVELKTWQKKKKSWSLTFLMKKLGQQMLYVLVSLGCYNKKITGRVLTNSRNVLLTVLEARSPRASHWQIQCLVKTHFLIPRLIAIFSLCLCPAKAPPPNTIILGIGFQCMNLGGHKHSVSAFCPSVCKQQAKKRGVL